MKLINSDKVIKILDYELKGIEKTIEYKKKRLELSKKYLAENLNQSALDESLELEKDIKYYQAFKAYTIRLRQAFLKIRAAKK